MLSEGHFYALETGKSEDLAAFAHFLLTVTPYGQSKRDWQKDLNTTQTAKEVKDTSREPEKEKEKEKDKNQKSSKSIPKVDDDKKSTSGKTDKQSTGGAGKSDKPKNK